MARGEIVTVTDCNSRRRTPASRLSLPGFEYRQIQTTGANINVATRGKGPPVRLLHGYPENHLMWRDVAPRLAEEYFVVCADLRGYGDSSKPEGAPDHANYSKRVMALDMVEVMAALGHRQFLMVGHDRGGRVAYRLALDHPQAARRVALLDIVRLRWMLPSQAPLEEYLRTFGTPEGIHASCEDYRAGFDIDLPNDRADAAAGRKILCPTLILWGKRGAVGAAFQPLETWRDLVESPTGESIDCGHFIPEEKPDETVHALRAFSGGVAT
jgi:haloacetate dehalogenase